LVEQRTENASPNELIERFIESRPSGLSPLTIHRSYRLYLKRAREVIGFEVTGRDIQSFINSRNCSNSGKHAYFRNIKVFYNWLYSPKSGFGLNSQANPIIIVEPPKVEKKILPSLTAEELDYVINHAQCIRDKAIISLFADSGLRLSELANIEINNIDWEHRLIKVKCKGNKEGLAPFGVQTDSLLRQWLGQHSGARRLWDINRSGIKIMLRRLMVKTGLPCNAHTFRRTFASILAKRGVDSLHIQRLGRWESMSMVERYTRSVRFEDSLKTYSAIVA